MRAADEGLPSMRAARGENVQRIVDTIAFFFVASVVAMRITLSPASAAQPEAAKKPTARPATPSAARALPRYAPKSGDAAIKDVSLCSSEDHAFDPTRIGTTFRQGVKNVVVWYRWDGSPMGRRMDVRWSREGKVVLTQGENVDEASGESAWTLSMSAGGPLPPGGYRVELIEDGKTVTAIPFQIQ
jgi:hypothetical protein